jgi:DNA-binding CsgD family transcriptional regulator
LRLLSSVKTTSTTGRDLEHLSKATLALYAPHLNMATFADRAIHFLSTLVAADMYCAATLDPKTKSLDVVFSRQDSRLAPMLEGFGRTMGAHRLFNFDTSVHGGRPFFRKDFFSRRQFREVDVYKESMSLMGWNDHAAVHVPTTDGKTLFMSLERSGTVDYSERDRQLLTLAQPHLANAKKLADSRTRIRDFERADPTCFTAAGFSPREAEVLLWLTEGKTNTEMAIIMRVHVQTVKFHLSSIYNKIGSGNRLAATLHALEIIRNDAASQEKPRIAVRAARSSPQVKD